MKRFEFAITSFHASNCLTLSHQRVAYKTNKPVVDLRTIAEVEGAKVKAGKHAEWKEQIIVPPLPQSQLTGCNLIDIIYFIQVCVCVCVLYQVDSSFAGLTYVS